MPITSASKLRCLLPSRNDLLVLEPSFGCRLQCRQCSVEAPEMPPRFMKPSELDLQLEEFKKADFPTIRSVVYTARGNPLDNENLHEITRVVKKHLPNAKINSFWNLDGVPTQAELTRRTEGIDCLRLSFDAHHYAGHFSIQKQNEPRLSAGQLREKTLDLMFEKLRWAVNASKKNDFRVIMHLTGTPKEREFFRSHPVVKKLGKRVEIATFKRKARGSSLGKAEFFPQGSFFVVSHDCTVGNEFTRST